MTFPEPRLLGLCSLSKHGFLLLHLTSWKLKLLAFHEQLAVTYASNVGSIKILSSIIKDNKIFPFQQNSHCVYYHRQARCSWNMKNEKNIKIV